MKKTIFNNNFFENTTKTTTFQSFKRKYDLSNSFVKEGKTNNKVEHLGLIKFKQMPKLADIITRKFKNPNNIDNINLITKLQKLALKNNNSSRGLQLLDEITSGAPTNKWTGFIFIQKKGLSHTKANFKIINYNFRYGAYLNKDDELVTPNYNVNRILLNNVYKLLVIFFKTMYCIISKPVYIFTQDTIKIQLFYFACIGRNITLGSKSGVELPPISEIENPKKGKRSANKINYNKFFSNLTKVYPNKFKLICGILSKFLKKKVELDLIRLHKPYYNSDIFVYFLSLIINRKDITKYINKVFASKSMMNIPLVNSNKDNFYYLENSNSYSQSNSKFKSQFQSQSSSQDLPNKADNLTRKIDKSIQLVDQFLGFSKYSANNNDIITSKVSVSSAYLTGISIKIAGRLKRETVIPKVTTKKFEKGFTAKGRINYFENARFTSKNRKGAFSITIKSGQNF